MNILEPGWCYPDRPIERIAPSGETAEDLSHHQNRFIPLYDTSVQYDGEMIFQCVAPAGGTVAPRCGLTFPLEPLAQAYAAYPSPIRRALNARPLSKGETTNLGRSPIP
jgi:hypothetical protein